MNRRITLPLSAAAGGLLASAVLPAAIAFADTGTAADAAAAAASSFPEAPGPDAFTLGTDTFDPYNGATVITDPTTEGFDPLTREPVLPRFFETGDGGQNFEVFSAASGATPPRNSGVSRPPRTSPAFTASPTRGLT